MKSLRHTPSLRRIALALIGITLPLLQACNTIDNKRIPSVPVNIVFTTSGMWDIYGVSGALEYRYFQKDSPSQPANFPYTASMYTGYGGVLLACDYYGNPVAFDRCCPVECKPTTRVSIDTETHLAVCPVCNSAYSVFENYGSPVSGPAAERGYGLTIYYVASTATGQRVITR